MKGEDWLIVAFFALVVAIIVGAVFGISADNEDEWQQTEDPACYIKVWHDRHILWVPDHETRTKYCRS